MANDASLGWLLLPETRSVDEPQPMPSQRISEASRLDAEPLFPGLVIELSEVWAA